MKRVEDFPCRNGGSRFLIRLPRRFAARMEQGLVTPERHGVPYRAFNEFRERLAFAQNRLEFCPQGGLDTNLRNDGGLHALIVLQSRCMLNIPGT